MSEQEQRLRKAIEQAAQRGFEYFRIGSTRGDSNCPHPVTYHPKDGHGWEEHDEFIDTIENGQRASMEEEMEYYDTIEILARVFESFPEIKERELIK